MKQVKGTRQLRSCTKFTMELKSSLTFIQRLHNMDTVQCYNGCLFAGFLSSAGDLPLELFDVLHELLAARLEEQVAVHEPSGVAQTDELHDLRQQWDGVDSSHDGGGQPQRYEGTPGVD